MSRFRCATIAALAGPLAFPGAPAAAGPLGCSGYRCVQYGSRFNIASNRERFSRHGAAWRHDEFALSGYSGGPGIRRNYSLGWGVRTPACYWVGGVPDASDVTVVPQAMETAPAESPVERHDHGAAADPAAGPWGLLGAGRFAEARRQFAIAAFRDAGDAASMAGFALASAFRGEFDAATTALRTAVEADAASLRGLPGIGDVLRNRIRAAAEAASARAERDPSGGDPAFLAAGMYWVLDDEAAAMAAVLAAASRGDDAPATRILSREMTLPPAEPKEAPAEATPVPPEASPPLTAPADSLHSASHCD